MINKIRVIPKKDDNRLLEGDLFIVEDLWCISAADVNVRATGLKAKIKITCKEVQSSVFLPVSITTSSTIDIMGFKAEASYLAAIHYREVKTDIQPETSTDKTTKPVTANAVAQPKKHKFERPARIGRKDTQVDSLADKRDSLYWTTIRSVPLRLEEVQSYQYKEEKIALKDLSPGEKSEKKTTVGQVLNTIMWGKTFRTSNKNAWLTLPGLSAYIPEYNLVDGFWLGVKLKTGVKLSESSTLRFVPSFYYTTARKTGLDKEN